MDVKCNFIACLLVMASCAVQGATGERFDRPEHTVGVDSGRQVAPPSASDLIDRMPLVFEENRGQFDAKVKYLARGSGYTMFLTEAGSTIVLDAAGSKTRAKPAVVRMSFVGASPAASIEGRERVEQITNYFMGSRTSERLTRIPNFAKVMVGSLYPGVDAVFYGKHRELEYDLIVAPDVDPGRIRLQIKGAKKAAVNATGDLRLSTTAGDLLLRRPVAYQDVDGQRRSVAVDYVATAKDTFGFRLAVYDRSKPLVIDPILSYSTLFAGNNTIDPKGIAVDRDGHAYVVGYTGASDFPLAYAYQSRLAGTRNAFITKFNAAGTGILYSTYFGGSKSNAIAYAIAVDGGGNAYVTGTTEAASLPVTAGAYETTIARRAAWASYVAKFGPSGDKLIYLTYVNGVTGNAIAIDAGGNSYVAGTAWGPFKSTPGALQPVNHGGTDGLVIKLNPTATAATYATYLGGSGNDAINGIALDAAQNAYVAGDTASADFPLMGAYLGAPRGLTDAFVAKLDPSGSGLVYSTYLGGSKDDSAKAIAVDAEGNAYAAGVTESLDFPVLSAFQPMHGMAVYTTAFNASNAFITKLVPSGSALVYSSYLGGATCDLYGQYSYSCYGSPHGDGATAVAVDQTGNAYLAGYLASTAFPFPLPESIIPPGGYYVPFVAKVKADGRSLAYGMVLAEYGIMEDAGLAVDERGNAYVTGFINGGGSYSKYPVTAGAFTQYASAAGAFVAKLGTARVVTTLSGDGARCAGDPINLYAEVPAGAGAGAGGGSVAFYDGGTTLGTSPVSGGKATLASQLAAGVHTLTAVFSGDGKSSPPYYQIVNTPAVCQ